MRDGNLYLMALEAGPDTPFLQLTDIVVPEAAAATAGGQRAAGGGGAGGRGAGAGRAGGTGTVTETESQRFLREQERALIDFVRRQSEQRQEAAGRGGRGGRGGAADAPVNVAPIPRLSLTSRQTLADLQLSSDERFVWIGVTERPESTSRGQDTPNYVTESAYPEMISGRTNVGDVQSRRLLAVLDRKENKNAWADALVVRRRRAQGEVDGPGRAAPAELGHARALGRRLAERHCRPIGRQQGSLAGQGRSGVRQDDRSRHAARRRVDPGRLGRRRRCWRGHRVAARQQAGGVPVGEERLDAPLLARCHRVRPAGARAHDRQVGSHRRAAVKRSEDGLPDDQRGPSGRATVLHDVARLGRAHARDVDDRLERGDGVAGREAPGDRSSVLDQATGAVT